MDRQRKADVRSLRQSPSSGVRPPGAPHAPTAAPGAPTCKPRPSVGFDATAAPGGPMAGATGAARASPWPSVSTGRRRGAPVRATRHSARAVRLQPSARRSRLPMCPRRAVAPLGGTHRHLSLRPRCEHGRRSHRQQQRKTAAPATLAQRGLGGTWRPSHALSGTRAPELSVNPRGRPKAGACRRQRVRGASCRGSVRLRAGLEEARAGGGARGLGHTRPPSPWRFGVWGSLRPRLRGRG